MRRAVAGWFLLVGATFVLVALGLLARALTAGGEPTPALMAVFAGILGAFGLLWIALGVLARRR